MQIVSAQKGDAEFIIAFNQKMALETENRRLPDDVIGPGVHAMLDDPQKGLYLLAKNENGEILGQLMVTFEWSDWRNSNIWWIQSVFVSFESRRQGVYRALYNHIYQQASTDDTIGGIRLYVDQDNNIAQQTYSNLGMTKSHYQMYEIDFLL